MKDKIIEFLIFKTSWFAKLYLKFRGYNVKEVEKEGREFIDGLKEKHKWERVIKAFSRPCRGQ